MREIERRMIMGRRVVLRGAATAVPAAALVSGGAGISAKAVWAQEAQTLKPHTMATLVLMARDIYPHDQIADVFYVKAVQPYDDKASSDAGLRDLLEQGVADLDSAARTSFKQPYLGVPEERDRLVILNGLVTTPFFAKVRSGLVVGLYNQPDLWRRFGYEGSSAEYGGYLNRGFNDIDWLPKA